MNQNDSTTCKYFVPRKKRHCRISPRLGEEYCPEHQPIKTTDYAKTSPEDEGSDKIRIVCPLDRKHTCYAHNLKKHLKICNARPKDNPPYIQKGVNSGITNNVGDGVDETSTYKLLSSFSVEEINRTVSKVNKLFEDNLIDKTTEKFCSHEIVEEEISKPEYGEKTLKHLKQASAILGLLKEHNLMQPKTCFIEFGAGRGQLSYWLCKANNNRFPSDCSYLLIERSSPKHKRDNKLNKEEDQVQRIRADIADLVLDKVETVSEAAFVVGVTKHLCGDATDLTLRCLANLGEYKTKFSGCLMTFCCHHRCRWGSYTGKQFFQENGLNESDFNMMCNMSSWATCGTGYSREKISAGLSAEDKACQSDRDKELGLSREEKELVGKRCKSIINWGRLDYLERLGLTCSLHYYVSPEVSPENVCIVAFNNNIKHD